MNGADLERLRECGLTELFRETDLNSPSRKRSTQENCVKMLFAESQELGTQDFATPRNARKQFGSSQGPSQPASIPSLRPPESVDPGFKRGRASPSDLSQGRTAKLLAPTPCQAPEEAYIDKGAKKVKAYCGLNKHTTPDFCTCSPQEAFQLDVDSILKHHAIPAGGPGSFAHTFLEQRQLGQGEFGRVSHARNLLDGGEYAVKMCDLHKMGSSEVVRALREGQLMRLISHSRTSASTVGFSRMWIESSTFKNKPCYQLLLQMELCGSSLAALKRKTGPLSAGQLTSILYQVSGALAALHALNFAHLDVKPSNILTVLHRNDAYKLGDFGLAVRTDGQWEVEEGDRRYLPGELLAGSRSNLSACDVFSLALTLIELASDTELPVDDGPDYQRLRAGEIPPLPGLPPEMRSLLQSMVNPDASRRPSARSVMESARAWNHVGDRPQRTLSSGGSCENVRSQSASGHELHALLGCKGGAPGADGRKKTELKPQKRPAAPKPSLSFHRLLPK